MSETEPRSRLRRWGIPVLIAVAAVVLLYYPIGMAIVHRIDDDTSYQLPVNAVPPGGSRAVAMAAALISREVNENRWVANDPFFLPGSMLDNMPHFQLGIIAALGRFSFELTDQLGRTRGSSQTDSDLQEASGLLQYSGTKWVFDFSTSLMPTAAAEQQYRKALASLLNYNRRLSDGKAVFEKRTDNLMAVLDRISLDLGSASAALDQQVRQHSGLWDGQADDLFYTVKGKAYAYYLLLRELRVDFDSLPREAEIGPAFAQMLESLAEAGALHPLVVINAKPDALILPSHLTGLGFYILRARTQMREINGILQR